MPAGTIELTNGSTAVTGSGTSFATELKVNDFVVAVVGGVTYTLGVQAIGSATALTLTTAFNGPSTSGLAWTALPNAALVGITAQVGADVAKAIRGFNFDKVNWQKIFSNTALVTVTLPDLTSFTGPSWGYMASQFANKANTTDVPTKSNNLSDLSNLSTAWTNLLNARGAANARTDLGFVSGALPISLGGTGATDAGTARTNLLNNAINWELMNTEMRRYAMASGRQNANVQGAGVWQFNNTPFGTEQYGVCIQVNNRSDSSGSAGTGVWQHYLALGTGGNIIYARNINSTYSANKLYSTSNTTTNSSGALVPASPIVRIVNDRDAVTRSDILGVDNAEYTWSTKRGLYNDESKGCTVSRTDVGTYLVKGATGLAKDLWTVMDCGNGQGRIIALAEAEETTDGIVVRCYKQKNNLSNDGDLTIEKGTLIDIPAETWIDVRLEMPADSDYNLRQKEIADQMQAQEFDESGS